MLKLKKNYINDSYIMRERCPSISSRNLGGGGGGACPSNILLLCGHIFYDYFYIAVRSWPHLHGGVHALIYMAGSWPL